MSQENVENLRQAFDAFNRRDRVGWLALSDPDLEAVPSRNWPETAPVRGREAVWDFLIQVDALWEESPFELVELIDAGIDKVVARQRREMLGRASGAAVVYDYWGVVTFREGRSVRTQWFDTRAEALKAVGLAE